MENKSELTTVYNSAKLIDLKNYSPKMREPNQ